MRVEVKVHFFETRESFGNSIRRTSELTSVRIDMREEKNTAVRRLSHEWDLNELELMLRDLYLMTKLSLINYQNIIVIQ